MSTTHDLLKQIERRRSKKYAVALEKAAVTEAAAIINASKADRIKTIKKSAKRNLKKAITPEAAIKAQDAQNKILEEVVSNEFAKIMAPKEEVTKAPAFDYNKLYISILVMAFIGLLAINVYQMKISAKNMGSIVSNIEGLVNYSKYQTEIFSNDMEEINTSLKDISDKVNSNNLKIAEIEEKLGEQSLVFRSQNEINGRLADRLSRLEQSLRQMDSQQTVEKTQ